MKVCNRMKIKYSGNFGCRFICPMGGGCPGPNGCTRSNGAYTAKKCTQCGQVHPTTTEYFHKQSAAKDGLTAQCKWCAKKYRKKYSKTITGHLRHVFGSIKQRCNDPNKHNYNRYGGRGIKICFTSDEFLDYVINELKIDPRGLQCDRINNDGDYERGNIRFVTNKVNCQNRFY